MQIDNKITTYLKSGERAGMTQHEKSDNQKNVCMAAVFLKKKVVITTELGLFFPLAKSPVNKLCHTCM